ncbi:hypothetical protein BSKO_00532 [Bryopsis sp. KO-2023]|nr:hypothetical protein BSKO_00532 [Bryopsis sp. KO-2023]
MESLLDFSDDLLLRIVSLLDPQALCATSCTCKRLQLLSDSEHCWKGGIRNLIYGSQSLLSDRTLARKAHLVWKSIKDKSWGSRIHRLLSNAIDDDLQATQRKHGIEFGNFLPTRTIRETGAIVLLADLRKMVLIGPTCESVKSFIPPNSLNQLLFSGCMLSPHEVLRFLAFEYEAVNCMSDPDALIGSLRQLHLDCRKQEIKTVHRGGSQLYPSIHHLSTSPDVRAVCIQGMKMGDFENYRQLYGGQHLLDVLDISDFNGDDHDVLAVLCDLRNLSSFIAQRTGIGGHTLMMMGSVPSVVGMKLRRLDLSGCQLKTRRALPLFRECLKRMKKLEVLGLADTETGEIFADVLETGMGKVLDRLEYLDVAHVADMTAEGLANILWFSRNLRTLICHDCQEIGGTGGEAAIINHILKHGCQSINDLSEAMPRLHTLSCGWGFGGKLLGAVWKASPHMVCFRGSIGASISDALLHDLAKCCPSLEKLALEACPVSSQGMRKILLNCPWLHTLQLMRCVGPFREEMLEGLDGVFRVDMKEVCIVWSGWGLSEAGLMRLIGHDRPNLEHLEIVGCKGLSDALLRKVLHVHAPHLRVLRLEECKGASEEHPHAFTCKEVEELVLSCPRLTSLRLRHSCMVDGGFVKRIVEKCPLLEDFLVDKCDASQGIEAVEVQQFSALRYVQVAECSFEKPFLQGGVGLSGALGPRRRDKDILAMDLLTRVPKIITKE